MQSEVGRLYDTYSDFFLEEKIKNLRLKSPQSVVQVSGLQTKVEVSAVSQREAGFLCTARESVPTSAV